MTVKHRERMCLVPLKNINFLPASPIIRKRKVLFYSAFLRHREDGINIKNPQIKPQPRIGTVDKIFSTEAD